MQTASSGAPTPIDFWFDFASNYSYLSVMRIEEAAARQRVEVRWHPFLLGPIFRALGHHTSPFVEQKEKGAYVWQDMVRECRKYGLPWVRPSVFPRVPLLALRVAAFGVHESWIGAYCRQVMLRNFAEDRDIESPADIGEVLAQLGLPAEQILADALADANRPALRHATEEAQAKGIFGAPTFFVGDEMFWGNDRLDDALARCTSTSAPPRT
ncbi:2-hydroxychromene-2-carboxylate isomerase [Paraburkholderia flava]|uniref:2-hydroxychromene-2-carboxylate isomerase n=1 Tax=Paraburkholderia flava TaxID=2547393 RepID=UPI00105E13F5|nr:2-hydroxychromene-2-carboxylate isomerase [Paraburkholderia flava]